MTVTDPADLPPAAELIEIAREGRRLGWKYAAIGAGEDADPAILKAAAGLAASASLDVYAPEIDRLINTQQAAEWLDLKPRTIYQARNDGKWPDSDLPDSRSPFWRCRTLILFLAARPGRGAPGVSRPRKHTETEAKS
jgi:hypothetical protein